MLIEELIADLQNLTGRKITQTELGTAMGNLKRQTINTRIKNKSEVTVSELLNVQNYMNVYLYAPANNNENKFIKNSLNRRNDTNIITQLKNLGIRLDIVQNKHEYLDKDMAKLLKISENDYINIKLGANEMDFKTLTRIKQLFEISTDWLLYGE